MSHPLPHPPTVLARPAKLGLGLSFCLVALLAGPASAVDDTLVCGRDIVLTQDYGRIPDRGLQMRQPTVQKKAATIVLNAGPGLSARPDALAAWNRAVDIWEAVLGDGVTVTINGDFAPLGTGVLGGTSSRSFLAPYNTVRNAVVTDRAADESFVSQLPSAAGFNITVPPGFGFSGNVSGTKAVLRAIGFDMSFDDPNPDATITFSTGFEADFDYDPSDGIEAGKFDFEAIVVHEIGHALGFTSEVDDADFLRNDGQAADLTPTTLDLFRLLSGQGATNFTSASRQVTTGDLVSNPVFWDGSQDLRLSTGVNLGDGRQASHWKADELTGVFIGIMDPTLSRGVREVLEPNDLRAFGLIGWDVVNVIVDCNDNGIDDGDDITNGTSQDCNANGAPDECDIANGISQDLNGNSVPDECEPDCNGNSVPDELDISNGIEQDCNLNGIPDSCDIDGGASQDTNLNTVPDECEAVAAPEAPRTALDAHPNPFNPRTSIHFEMPSDGHARLDVYDVTGRHVRTLTEGKLEAGRHRLEWDGRGQEGGPVSSGVYYVVFRHDGGSRQIKITLLK